MSLIATNCVQVALDLPLPRLFDYLTPADENPDASWLGCRVRVPFGSQTRLGLVVGISSASDAPANLKAVESRIDFLPILSDEQLQSLNWLARYCGAAQGETLFTALPAPLRAGAVLPELQQYAWVLTSKGGSDVEKLRSGAPKRLAQLLFRQALHESELDVQFDQWRTPMRSLRERGLVERISVENSSYPINHNAQHVLNVEQEQACEQILPSRDQFKTFLLDGVTGSGKTEVYIAMIRDALARGKQSLVLVPEIGLTPQTLKRFRDALGVPVHALHSNLSDGERMRVWAGMTSGQAQVLIGTRSAVFSPLPNAGLIVVDEEHDSSYKQQDGIRYHARDFAVYRAHALNVPIVLGSATPSLESLHNAQSGRYMHLHLSRRARALHAAQVRVVDIRKRELQAGLGVEALAAIRACVERGEQALVFKNRRGYAPVLLCHDCGWSAQCTRCDSPMTLHSAQRRLICHHCGAQRTLPKSCPQCQSLALQPQGVGTERLEEVLAQQFPKANIVRVDRDSTRQRDGMQKQLDKLGNAAGIWVGTQMLAKGHDLPNLTLVVVVGADEGLFSADFRAGEKLAQLLIQVSGRAGRAEKPGEIIVQTHHPEHLLLNTLLNHGYAGAAAMELANREAAHFPPYTHMLLLRAEAKHADACMQFLHAAKNIFSAALANEKNASDVELLGPMPAPMPKRAGYVRAQLLINGKDRALRQRVLNTSLQSLHALPEARKVRWSIDVDPIELY